jgi:uncharacterized membrane protein
MEKKGFSVGEVIKFGWETFKKHVGFFIGLLIIAFAVQIIPHYFSGYFQERYEHETETIFAVFSVILAIVGFVLSFLVSMGFIKVGLRLTNNEKPKISDLFTTFPKIIKYFVSYLIYSIIVFVGFVLLVFPAIIWGTRYSLYGYFIIDKGAGPIEALKLSAKATMGAKWDIFGFWVVAFFIALAGVLCLIVGSFAAIPIIVVASAYVYRKLIVQTGQDAVEQK